MGTVAKVCVGVGLAVAAIYALIYMSTQVSMDTAERRGRAAEEQRVAADGDRRVAIREEFFTLCSAIQSQGEKIENQEALVGATSDPERKEELQVGLVALQNERDENVAEYNAKAANTATRGRFRAAELPARIDPDAEEVSCGSAQ